MFCLEMNDLKQTNLRLLRHSNVNKLENNNFKVNKKITLWLTLISRRIVSRTTKSINNGDEKPKVIFY